MSTHRYSALGITTTQFIVCVPGATTNGAGNATFMDVTLVDDANKDDLDSFMLQVGFVFVETSPATGRPGLVQTGTTGNRPTAVDGTMYYDSTLAIPIWAKAASATGWIDATGADA